MFLVAAGCTAPDYAVVALSLAIAVTIGCWVGRGQDSLGEYFLAGRNTHWLLACISIIATDLSAISYMGVPGWLYRHDLKFTFGGILTPLAFFLVIVIFIPTFYRLQVFTTYEFLEGRFHPLARTVAAVLFLFQRGVWLAAAIYVPSLAIATFADLPLLGCILAVGLLSTLYTMIGGMKAVIWTDLVQFIISMSGLAVIIGVLMAVFKWDIISVWRQAGSMIAPDTGTPHTTLVDWSFDLKTEGTVWSLMFFYVIYSMGTYGTDQLVAQRYFTMNSYRDIFKSIMASSLLSVAVTFLLGWMGLLLVLYYHQHPELAATLKKPDQIVPHFVVNTLPAGVRGLILAAIVAETMSSLSAGFNSFSTVGVMDLYKRYFEPSQANETRDVKIAKIGTLLSGVMSTVAALWISTLQTDILQTLIGLASKFVGPITGIFLLGLLTRRGNLAGVLVGATVGLVTSFLMGISWIEERVDWLWTAPLVCVITFVVGYVTSLLVPYQPTPVTPAVPPGLPDDLSMRI
jgi:solute carrier family 5 (sodium-coupled monocarboxylate transporter), member 8/12